LFNFDLELAGEAEKLFNGEHYEEASRVYTEIIDKCNAISPLYKYKRAKCYWQMGEEYLNAARSDLHKTLTY